MRATYLCAACGTNLVEHHSMCCEPCMDAYSARAHIHKCHECDANELCHDAECTFVSVNPDWHPRGEPRLCDEHQASVRQARTIRRLRALADGYRALLGTRRREGCGIYICKMDLLPSGERCDGCGSTGARPHRGEAAGDGRGERHACIQSRPAMGGGVYRERGTMTDFELREQRGWAIWRQSSFTGEWRTDGPIFALEMAALSNASDSSIVEEVTIRPVSLGADPVQWAAVQMAMALLDAIYAAQPCGKLHRKQCGCFVGYLASSVKAAFGICGSLEREP